MAQRARIGSVLDGEARQSVSPNVILDFFLARLSAPLDLFDVVDDDTAAHRAPSPLRFVCNLILVLLHPERQQGMNVDHSGFAQMHVSRAVVLSRSGIAYR